MFAGADLSLRSQNHSPHDQGDQALAGDEGDQDALDPGERGSGCKDHAGYKGHHEMDCRSQPLMA